MIHLKIFVTVLIIGAVFMAMKVASSDRAPTARDLGFGSFALVLVASGITGFGALLSWVWGW